MSIRSKSYDKTSENSKAINLNYCRGAKIYRDPQLLSKRKVIINESTSKQMYKFGSERRFQNFAKPWDAFHYDLPSVKDRFTTTLGKGSRHDFFKNIMKDKTHCYYDIPREFDLKRRNTPQYSFGKGRDICKKPEYNVEKPTPGVGSYNIGKNLGDDALKFSIFGREWVNRKISPSNSLITPGPGHYEETLKTNASGNYASSLYGNTTNIKFVGPQRFKDNTFKTPGPGNYEAKTMFNQTGSYDVFSDFNGYTDVHKKCKCGRRLGHPPIYDGPNACDRDKKSMTINTESNRSKKRKDDVRYKTIN